MGLLLDLPKFLEAFREGKAVADPKTWKERTVATNAVLALLGTLVAIAHGMGIDLNLDPSVLPSVAGGIVGIVGLCNAIIHVVTSPKVGLSPNGGTGT